MSGANVRLLAANGVGVTILSGSTNYAPLATTTLVAQAAEATAQVTWRTGGVISKLACRIIAGNRAPGTVKLFRNGAADVGGCSIAYTATPGEFEDASGTNTVSAGDTISVQYTSGGGGNTNFVFTHIGCVWAATNDTTTHMAAAALAYAAASETSYRQFSAAAAKTTTQADGEWLVRLPVGVDHVTIKNLYVRASANTSTNAITVSVNGATGTGTAPTVTIAGGSGATTVEDTTNSVQAKDGDLLSLKVVTGAGTVACTIAVTHVEVQSDDGVSFWLAAHPAGTSLAVTTHLALTGNLGSNATETNVAAKSNLSSYLLGPLVTKVKTAGAGTLSVRVNGADILPTPIAISTAVTGWQQTAATTIYTTSTTDTLNYRFVRTATPALTCVALTVVQPASATSNPKTLTITQVQTATVRRSVAKTVAATALQTPTVVRQAGKPITATQVQTATVSRAAGKVTTVTQAQTPTVTRSTAKTVTATNTQTPTVVKAIAKTITVTQAQVVSLLAQLAHIVTMTVTQVQTSSIVRQAAKVVTVTQAQTATMVRSVAKTVTVTAVQTATMVRSVAKTFTVTAVQVVSILASASAAAVTHLFGGRSAPAEVTGGTSPAQTHTARAAPAETTGLTDPA